MKPRQEWYQTFFPGLYARVLPATFSEAETLGQARLVKRLLRLRRGQRVLDIPSGQGRLTIPLAAMGLTMTGVDLTPSYIRRARRLAREAGVDVRFHARDMREIEFEEEFHAAFNWFSSFGYFSDAGNLLVCRRVLRALKPGGLFLIDVINKTWLLTHFIDRQVQTIGGVHIRSQSEWNERTKRVTSCWTLSWGRVVEQCSFSLRLFDASAIRKLLHQAGFREIQLYGRPPTGRLTRHSRRLIAVGRRPRGTSG